MIDFDRDFINPPGDFVQYVTRAALLVLLAFLSGGAYSQGVPESCLVSFNVKPKGFSLGNASVSCMLLEARRVDLTQQAIAIPDTGEVDALAVAKKLDAFEADIKKQQDAKNWVGLGSAVTGNMLATYGLGACLETMGAGCFVAAIGKLMAVYSIYDSASAEVDKDKQATTMRAMVADLRKVVAGKKSQAKNTRDRLTSDVTAMCTAVRTNCL